MQNNLVEQLRDIHQPAVPAGDSLQIVLLLAILTLSTLSLACSLWRLHRRSRPGWQQRAIDELDHARQLASGDSLAVAAMILRRAVSHMDAPADIAKTSGGRYLQQLDALFDCDFFTSGSGAVFGDPLYQQKTSAIDAGDAIDGVSNLLRQHRT